MQAQRDERGVMATRLALRIQERFESLTASERKLASLLLDRPDEILTFSATELAGPRRRVEGDRRALLPQPRLCRLQRCPAAGARGAEPDRPGPPGADAGRGAGGRGDGPGPPPGRDGQSRPHVRGAPLGYAVRRRRAARHRAAAMGAWVSAPRRASRATPAILFARVRPAVHLVSENTGSWAEELASTGPSDALLVVALRPWPKLMSGDPRLRPHDAPLDLRGHRPDQRRACPPPRGDAAHLPHLDARCRGLAHHGAVDAAPYRQRAGSAARRRRAPPPRPDQRPPRGTRPDGLRPRAFTLRRAPTMRRGTGYASRQASGWRKEPGRPSPAASPRPGIAQGAAGRTGRASPGSGSSSARTWRWSMLRGDMPRPSDTGSCASGVLRVQLSQAPLDGDLPDARDAGHRVVHLGCDDQLVHRSSGQSRERADQVSRM